MKVQETSLEQQIEKLQAFKDYVHQRLDDAGVPADPDPEKTAETGCRIGRRLDWLLDHRIGQMESVLQDIVGEEDFDDDGHGLFWVGESLMRRAKAIVDDAKTSDVEFIHFSYREDVGTEMINRPENLEANTPPKHQ